MQFYRSRFSAAALLSTFKITSVFSNYVPQHGADTIRTLYVAHQARGILTIGFDPTKPANSSLSIIDTSVKGGYLPQWLHLHGDKLYSVSRAHYPTANDESGGVFAFDRQKNGSLSLLNSVPSSGLGAVYVDVSPDGRTLSAPNIDGSSLSIYTVSSDSSIGNETAFISYELPAPNDVALHPGLNESQIAANPHESIFDPSGEYMFVPDRGSDRVYVYAVDGPGSVHEIRNITLPPGTGPRHIAFQVLNETHTFMYLVSELDNTLRLFTLDGVSNSERDAEHQSHTWAGSSRHWRGAQRKDLEITPIQTISTIGLTGADVRTQPNNTDLAAEVAISSDNRFAYVSNRHTTSFDSDTLAVFAIDLQAAEPLTYIGANATYGKIPRHFSLSDLRNGDSYVAVGNEVTNNLVLFERDTETGFMKDVVGKLELGMLDLTQKMGPTCVVWA